MRMKKRIRMFAFRLAVLLILAGFLSYCAGSGYRQQPKTEPGTAPAETGTETVPETGTQEPLQQTAESEEQGNQGTGEPVPATPVARPGGVQNETIPLIEPLKKVETLELRQTLNSGIANIFKDFGYSGDIRVPGSFEKRIAHYIRYFTKNEKGIRFFKRAMRRGSQYLPMIQKVLKKKHLPLSLAYLPVVESGFNPNARSRAQAVGMWQFMKGTARMYGLKVARDKDERTDPVKSTYAAAEYLNDLLAMFGLEDPFLGICAYNAGEGRILNALRRISYKERSFWTLVKKSLLRYETNEYIPQFIAVILIAGEPEKYASASGEVPEETDEKEDLETAISRTGSKEDLGEEKAAPEPARIELKKIETKPAQPSPAPLEKPGDTARVYKVKRGDSLYRIARRFGVGVKRLKKWNGLQSNSIYPGQRLKIYAAPGGGTPAKPAADSEYKLIYTVNYTDSLARIALFFKGIGVRDIMNWNRLRRSRIYPRQKLLLYLEESPRKVLTHVVKHGETAWIIAEKYGVRVEYVLSLNGMVTNSRLKTGRRLKIYYF